MTSIDFRCEHCGKLLNVAAQAGPRMQCPHCGRMLDVPAGIADMPTPKTAMQSGLGAADAASDHRPVPVQVAPDGEGEVVVGVMARIMPWVMSVFFHAGLAMILAFATMLVPPPKGLAADSPTKDPIYRPDGDDKGMIGDPKLPRGEGDGAITTVERRKEPGGRQTILAEMRDKKTGVISILGAGPSGKGTSGLGLGNGPGVGFFGPGGGGDGGTGKGARGYHVVYLIDRSGSMLDSFDFVRRELLRSISLLKSTQDFHVIFFASGTPQENPPGQLVPAIDDYKALTADYLRDIRPESQTDPLPALKRAFDVLEKADPAKPGRIIFLLTDGVFPDNAKVLQYVKERNAKLGATICTRLFDDKSADAMKVLRQIAQDSGGDFKAVSSQD